MNALVRTFQAVDFTSEMLGSSQTDRDERARQAYQSGYADGQADAKKKTDERIIHAADAAAASLAEVRCEAATRWATFERDAAECVITIARKLTASLILPEDVVAETLRTALAEFVNPPHLTVTVHPALAERLAAISEDIKQHADQMAHIKIATDAALQPSDCRIIWAGGAICRDAADLERQIDGIIHRAFQTRTNAEDNAQ